MNATDQGRHAWIDVGRAIAIVLVVLFHATQALHATGWDLDGLVRLNSLLATFRMPLFFTISGLLASTAVATLSLRALFWRRIALLVYIYVLWCLIRAAVFAIVPWPFEPGRLLAADLLTALIQPWSGLWFVYALALYLVIAWAARRLPAVVQLAGAAAIGAVFAAGVVRIDDDYTWQSIGTYLVFFVLGVLGRDRLLAFAGRLRLPAAAAIAVVFAASLVALHLSPWPDITRYAFSFLGVAFGIALAVTLARVAPVARFLGYLGRRTLPIYVVHVPVVGVAVWLVPAGSIPALVAAPALTVVAIAAALGIHRATARFDGLFTLPAPLARIAARESGRAPLEDRQAATPTADAAGPFDGESGRGA